LAGSSVVGIWNREMVEVAFRSLFVSTLLLALSPTLALAQSSTDSITFVGSAVFATAPPNDPTRLFVIDQGSLGTARIHVINKNTKTSLGTFLTLNGLHTGSESGLLGLAFHPDYATNGFFYVYASVQGGSQNHRSEIRRYKVLGDPAISNVADASSLQPILSFQQPFSNHNGGWIGFNPKLQPTDPEYLYIGTGDGGSGGDPQNNAQDITNNRLGKLLRIDVDGDDFLTDVDRNYAIPPDNPFVGQTGDDEIWSFGLRNPYRNSFDRKTGDLWLGDVGQNAREEIDFQPVGSDGGENWGWRVKEGDNCFDNSQAGGNPPCNAPELLPPTYDYGRGFGPDQGFAVIGGYVYRGSVAQYEGHYFFADYLSNNLWTLDPHAIDVDASVTRRNALLGTTLTNFSSFGEDTDGELYLVSLGGFIERIITSARESVWNGNTAVGNTGDGSSWSDNNNWTRDGVIDAGFLTSDEIRFVSGSSQPTINLGTSQSVSSVRFDANYTVQNGLLTVLSGNITTSGGVVATIDSNIMAETVHASVRKLGTGTLLVNGNVEQTVVMEGTLGGSGTVANLKVMDGASVAPGNSAGQLTVTNDFSPLAGSTLDIEIGGETPITEHDVLSVGDRADLNGTVSFTSIGGWRDPIGRGDVDEFVFLNSNVVQGIFNEVIYDGVALQGELLPIGSLVYSAHQSDGLFRIIRYDSTSTTLQNYLALDGDVNGDFIVNFIDFEIISENLFTVGTDWITGDLTGDGVTDIRDFNVWNANKSTFIAGVSLQSIVPEPNAMTALSSVLVIFAWAMFNANRNPRILSCHTELARCKTVQPEFATSHFSQLPDRSR